MPHIWPLLLLGFSSMTAGGFADQSEAHALQPAEQELAEQINTYRKSRKLPPIPISPSLSKVARIHAQDLADHAAHREEGCNLHSWSDQGSWTPCCYTPDHAQSECMWGKPAELTDYPGRGYEISYTTTGEVDPATALERWKKSRGHHAVIINEGTWSTPWKAMGVGIVDGFAHVWFGHEADPVQP